MALSSSISVEFIDAAVVRAALLRPSVPQHVQPRSASSDPTLNRSQNTEQYPIVPF